MKTLKCYLSKLTDPWINLAFEEWLFRDTDPNKTILYLWRNDPCVVIGRNQNPWKECNVQLLNNHKVPLIRRKSGGGTVFHDLGNTNYSLITPRQDFSRKNAAELVTLVLQSSFNVPAYVRSAFKLITGRSYHHGTMLINADINKIRRYLKVEKEKLITKGVESIPSPVTNLINYSSSINHQLFCDSMIKVFMNHYHNNCDKNFDYNNVDFLQHIDDRIITEIPKINQYVDELKSWEWTFGQTPEFTHEFETEFKWGHVKVFIKSKNGLIKDVIFTSTMEKYYYLLDIFKESLEGCKYDEEGIDQAVDKIFMNVELFLDMGIYEPLDEINELITNLSIWIKKSL
ncbi:13431_t:CDS:10 [Entrophospora sp. SA101]|nr:4648_t:CDS:10 [Entrophospora sp. SA101]CAJ0760592.1 13431_t:CDS:10 [Entrophospora sp. SA101]CAJ0825474.1 13230_t:CDS:10 [Entrophospora sp. SA101]CAJ0841682.1 14214_t:CDS:10 [Entrophospora sp. SA101]CAJ0848724.1 929_t:CDS:10 [Entrophospora sp. SA101]